MNLYEEAYQTLRAILRDVAIQDTDTRFGGGCGGLAGRRSARQLGRGRRLVRCFSIC